MSGTSINESSGVPVLNDIEILTIDTTINQWYQTTKKWLEVTSVNVTSGTVTGLTYETIILGYTDIGNRNFVISGYRVEAVAGVSGDKSDVRLFIEKIQDDGGGKTSLILLEDIGVDNETNQIVDYLRIGSDDRSYTATLPAEIWPDNSDFVFKQTDFDTFFTSDQNIILSSDKDEGILIRLTGNTLGAPSGTPYNRVQIRYYLI